MKKTETEYTGDLHSRENMTVPGIRPDDPRLAQFPMVPTKPAKVYVAGSCYHCAYLPEAQMNTPKFCPECGRKFIPVEPQNAADKEEV